MDIPVSGFMYASDGSDPLHSHRMYITSWDGRPVHVHSFSGITSFEDGHSHQYAGTTEPAPTGVPIPIDILPLLLLMTDIDTKYKG